MSFIFIFCLISLAGTSSAILNKSSERRILILFLIFKGKLLYCYIEYDASFLCLSCMTFILLRYFPFLPSLLVAQGKDVKFCQILFVHPLKLPHDFDPFLYLEYLIYCFAEFESSFLLFLDYIPLDHAWYTDPFNVLLNSVC